MRPRLPRSFPFLSAVPVLGLALLLAGCGGPPPKPPTVANLAIAAESGANGGAPVSLRVYQLVSPAAFEGAQFFQLFNNDAATLKDDLVKRDDLLLAPGQSRAMLITPPERVTAIGIFAGVQDYQKSSWRALVTLPPNQTSKVAVTVAAAGVTAKIEPPKP